MQAQGPPLPKVDVEGLYDNSLLKSIEAELDRATNAGSPNHGSTSRGPDVLSCGVDQESERGLPTAVVVRDTFTLPI
jgi:hypothetical protein